MAKSLFTAKVFLEDTVQRRDQPDRLGLVVKTWHDFESGDDSDEDVSIGPLAVQQVVVHWADGSKPEVIHEDALEVTDRSFSHGDVVKRLPNDTMSGTVLDVKVELDLEKVCPPMTRFSRVDAKEVDFVQQFEAGNHVIYKDWLGVIDYVSDEVTVLLNGNGICVIKDPNDLDFYNVAHEQSCFYPDTFSPGHPVRGSQSVFKEAKYLQGRYQPRQCQGYIVRNEITSITVDWLLPSPLSRNRETGETPPPKMVDDLENVVVYKSIEQHCTYQLMDRVKVVGVDTIQGLGLSEYCPYLRSKRTRLLCRDKSHAHASTFATEEMKVVGTRTQVSVQWQDLSVSEDVSSTSLIPYLNVDDQDLWPSDYVLLKSGEVLADEYGGLNIDSKKSDMLGIVQSVNAEERTAMVKWFSEERDHGLESAAEELSMYEIMSHPDLKFEVGDKVIVNKELDQSVRDSNTRSGAQKWIGQIWKVHTDRPTVLVQFMDGTSDEVPIGDVIVIEDDEDDDDEAEDDEEFEDYDFDHDDEDQVDSEASWETDSEGEEDNLESRAEEGMLEALTSRALPSLSKPLLDTNGESYSMVAVDRVMTRESSEPLLGPESQVWTMAGVSISEASETEHRDWRSFVTLEETPADHHFLTGSDPKDAYNNKAWLRRVSKEHSILSSSLPDGIRVRAFEDRLDLLRVLIEGPDHTPYRNTLLLFDFSLPSQFPSEPPSAFFHSWTGGIGKINPNLYEDGNVCLSLLNTWHGKERTETWTPNSSILQLLISLQGLVLVPEPYYNEAGFEKFVGTKEAARNSELYNEKVYLLSLKSIQTILLHPPAPFQDEVRHFYFSRQKLRQVVSEGRDKIAHSTTGEQGVVDKNQAAKGHPVSALPTSKGALKVLVKYVDALETLLGD